MFAAPWTTWLFVSKKPSGVKKNPEPVPLCLLSLWETSTFTTDGPTRSATSATARE